MNLHFEQQYYHITEGSKLSQPIRLVFTNNQNPFNLTVIATSISKQLEGLFYETGFLNNRAIEGKMLISESWYVDNADS